ncbi:heavy metal translocating P-type ATPase [Thioclava sp. FR2]|uniref:heavy metal translocating P-type ATPase n=1 Tax=Thioclava sp. FR2 TaxID=3445780 RepID=UPI003EBAB789
MTATGLAAALVDEYLVGSGAITLVGLISAYGAGAIPPAISALKALFSKGELDIDLLMVVAAVAAALVGAPVEGAVLLALFSISGALEHRAMGKARKAVEALMQLRPSVAELIDKNGTRTVPVSDLKPGDQVILRPGARVPVDGLVREGEGSMDESTITGESMPVSKAPGAALHEATVNLNAVLIMEVRRRLEESTVSQMVKLVTEAQAMKAPSEQFSAWFGQRYTWAVLIGSVLAYFGFLLYDYSHELALYRAATLLVAASPCAIVISVPAAILSALSASARGGVLFKGGAALERLAETRIFAFDKTGTLTTGKAVVTGVLALHGSADELLAIASGLEKFSEHPIASAIVSEAKSRSLTEVVVEQVVSTASVGIAGRAGERSVWAGNPRIALLRGANVGDLRLRDVQASAQTLVYVGEDERLLGVITVADEPRDTSARGIRALRSAGIERVVMMTGDRRPLAELVAKEMNISEVHADLLPADKVQLVDELANSAPTAFVGDGVNDAAALARADVGIAMGVAGSEVALQAADVALLSEDMQRLAEAHRLARRTKAVIRQNLGFALTAMIALVTAGAFFELPLPLAVIGHEGGTLLVVLNSLRLLWDPIRAS